MKQRPVRGVGALGVASVDSVKHLSTGVSVGIYRLFRLLWRGFADLTTGFAKAIYALVMDVGRGIGLLFAGKFDASGKWMGLGVVGFLENVLIGTFAFCKWTAIAIYKPFQHIGFGMYSFVAALSIGMWRFFRAPWRLW